MCVCVVASSSALKFAVCMQTWRIKKLPSACLASLGSSLPLPLSVERLIELLLEQLTLNGDFGKRCEDDNGEDDDTDPSLSANKLFDIFNEFALREMVISIKID